MDRQSLYDRSARKRTVSLTVNADLYAKTKAVGVNASKVAEEALAKALAEHRLESLKREIRQDLEAYNTYVAEHGSPADLVREHYRRSGDAV